MRIVFLLHNAYAIGGTVRTTLNLASALGEHGAEEEGHALARAALAVCERTLDPDHPQRVAARELCGPR